MHILPGIPTLTRVAALLVPLVGAACRPRPLAADVVPGVMLRASRLAHSDTVIFRRSVSRGGRDSSVGTRTVIRRLVTAPSGSRLLEVDQRFPGGGGEIVDTAVADLRTMRAIAHRSHQPKRVMRFAFVGDTVEGVVGARAAADDAAHHGETVRYSVGGPIFDSNVLEFVIAALPLEPGFKVVLPFFIHERGGRVAMPVGVVERARVALPMLGERDVWVVPVSVPGAPATIWIDSATREVVRVRYDIAEAALSFTDDRATPLRS